MCGIAGYFVKHLVASSSSLRELLAAIRQRGPDDEGICLVSRRERTVQCYRSDGTVAAVAAHLPHFEDDGARVPHHVAMVHARYAIIDLSAGGHQPFTSADGSTIAIYHGEVYNYRELRDELAAKGVMFRTTSDTEVLVEGYRLWREALWSRLNGFWAVALFDATDGSVVLCRDRLGVAPLYYRETETGVYYASSIAALVDVGTRRARPDPARVADFIESGLKDVDQRTCWAGIRALPRATAVRFTPGAFTLADARQTRYWSPPGDRLTEAELPFAEAVDRYRATMMSAVDVRLRADVKVAFELSGGLDSSSIVAAAAALGHRDLTTFTISVPESDETAYARSMLERYALDFRVLSDPEDCFATDAAAFARIIEEPYHSPNIYTHYRMRRRMKEDGVAVVLSGSGGDEVLAGYESEFWPQAAADLRANGRRGHAFVHDVVVRAGTWRRARDTMRSATHRVARSVLRRGARPAPHAPDGAAMRGDGVGASLARSYPALPFHRQMLHHLHVADLPYYLHSNDHFTMAIPVEHRFPFLDYRIVELGLQLPTAYLFRNGWTKYILRKAMEPLLPRRITWRREKMGFPFPLRRFLSTHRERFTPLLASVAAQGLTTGGDYETLRRDEPLRLWRACSTGLWLGASRS